jgi:type I site-specific restriction-modification system R (restriction) subunit
MNVDKRLAGIQAVQTLSRLNRSYSGPFGDKKTTYVLDDPRGIRLPTLDAFRALAA